ncbi:MAG: SWIM zinc finger family protein [Pseudomonadota bacterium]|nr:SWIM zinc finger family protein [Pseudomonadota bacterium]
MTIPSLTEAILHQQCSEQTFSKGRQYYRDGAVLSLIRRGNVLLARVEGSGMAPYRVRVAFDGSRIGDAECDCPYDWGGWCKHVVAALLACIHEPQSIEERPPLDQLLAGLNDGQMRELLLGLAAADADLAERVEQQIELMKIAATPGAPPALPAELDPRPFRRQVRAAIDSLDRRRPYEAYPPVGSVVDETRGLLDRAQAFIAAGDGRNALRLLEAITDEFVEEWTTQDSFDAEVPDFFYALGPLWTEALLSADLTAAEREEWGGKLSEWQAALDEYDMGENFDAALMAAELGWDDPALQKILRGEAMPEAAAERTGHDAELAVAYLNVLERRGEHQAYLNLAQAAGQWGAYALMLVHLDRLEEAAETGIRTFREAGDAFRLAQALHERQRPALALDVAEHGLTLDGRKADLAAWTRDLAAGLGEAQRALRAAVIAFKERPGLDPYLKVKELTGDGWPAQQAALLEHLRSTDHFIPPDSRVDVFLHEQRLDDAIAAVEKYSFRHTLERVMDAVIDHRPDWVIEATRKQAEEIMNAGRASHYDEAVEWLKRARAAYRAADREAAWRDYLAELRAVHGRKYKLMGLMKGL